MHPRSVPPGPVRRAPVVRALLTAGALATAAGCNTMPVPLPEDCQRIDDACRAQDRGTGTPHDCRVFVEAPATTETMCEARLTECLTACGAAPADAGGD